MTDEPDIIGASFDTNFGYDGDISFYIDDTRLTGFPKDGTIELRLNEMDTLEMTFYATGTNKDLIIEGKTLYIFTDRGTSPYKFIITHVNPKSRNSPNLI